MLHFNQRNCFKMFPDDGVPIETTGGGIVADPAEESTVPTPSTAKEYYLAKIAGVYDGDLPDPKTPTEFYLAKMAGVEVVGSVKKVFEQEFTVLGISFGTEPNNKGNYGAIISNVYDEAVDVSHLIAHIDGIEDNSSFNVEIPGDGTVSIRTSDASYVGTTHTLELFYKTVIEDVPVKTRTEQYLKAIAANQDSSDSSESGGVSKG